MLWGSSAQPYFVVKEFRIRKLNALPWTPHQHSLFIETLPIGRAEYDASDGRRGIQFSISLRIGLRMGSESEFRSSGTRRCRLSGEGESGQAERTGEACEVDMMRLDHHRSASSLLGEPEALGGQATLVEAAAFKIDPLRESVRSRDVR